MVPLSVVYWEATRRCNLVCRRCAAASQPSVGWTGLDTNGGLDLIDAVARAGATVLALSGGDPLCRPDVFDLAEYGTQSGLRIALATNGSLVTARMAARIADAGIARVAVGVDGPDAEVHDALRGVAGSHAWAVRSVSRLRDEGVSVQINAALVRQNFAGARALLDMAVALGADALHFFAPVPASCRLDIGAGDALSPDDFARLLAWLDRQSRGCPLDLKATWAPRYHFVRAAGGRGLTAGAGPSPTFLTDGSGRGGACFVSHEGSVHPRDAAAALGGIGRPKRFVDSWTASDGSVRQRDVLAFASFVPEEPFCNPRFPFDPSATTLEEDRHDSSIH
ncbi:MAG TPA: radical SAM protein [Vicinamibacterales bacterium]|jgi:MoaA/NifB/PqqE/SkfB family radical SAM enzyme|nr:radical SAM protein [Vicinamibacterales bacterium]